MKRDWVRLFLKIFVSTILLIYFRYLMIFFFKRVEQNWFWNYDKLLKAVLRFNDNIFIIIVYRKIICKLNFFSERNYYRFICQLSEQNNISYFISINFWKFPARCQTLSPFFYTKKICLQVRAGRGRGHRTK